MVVLCKQSKQPTERRATAEATNNTAADRYSQYTRCRRGHSTGQRIYHHLSFTYRPTETKAKSTGIAIARTRLKVTSKNILVR